MVRRGGRDRIDIFVFEQLSNVAVSFDSQTLFAQFPSMSLQHVAVGIAERYQANTLHFFKAVDVALTPAANADHCDTNVFVRASHLRPRSSRPAQRGGRGNGVLEECAAALCFHNYFL